MVDITLSIAIIVYLTAGLYFKSTGFNWIHRLILWLLWLPITLTLFLIYSSGKEKDK